jgi:hypothetical protein
MNSRHLFAMVCALTVARICCADTEKPNIVLLLADDLGRGDLHCYGHPCAHTLKIDSLPRDGN